jgi:hypothetical protein
MRTRICKFSIFAMHLSDEGRVELQIPRLPRISCRGWWRRNPHAVFLTENRTRWSLQCRWQEIRVRSELVTFQFPSQSWSESLEGHLPASIAGVLRLRTINPQLCDRSARCFAQGRQLYRGVKNIQLGVQKHEEIKKSQALPMYKTLNQRESVTDWSDVLFIGFHDLATGEVIGLGMTKETGALSFGSVAGHGAPQAHDSSVRDDNSF